MKLSAAIIVALTLMNVGPTINGYLAVPKDSNIPGLANAINDLVKEGFEIKRIIALDFTTEESVPEFMVIIQLDNGKLKNPIEANKLVEKLESIDILTPNSYLEPITKELKIRKAG